MEEEIEKNAHVVKAISYTLENFYVEKTLGGPQS